jgi:hypothetical protein
MMTPNARGRFGGLLTNNSRVRVGVSSHVLKHLNTQFVHSHNSPNATVVAAASPLPNLHRLLDSRYEKSLYIEPHEKQGVYAVFVFDILPSILPARQHLYIGRWVSSQQLVSMQKHNLSTIC